MYHTRLSLSVTFPRGRLQNNYYRTEHMYDIVYICTRLSHFHVEDFKISNGAKRSETDPPKAQAHAPLVLWEGYLRKPGTPYLRYYHHLLSLISYYLRHNSTWNCRRTDNMIPTYMELSTDRQYDSNVSSMELSTDRTC
jgi:hypothetical protein